MATDFGPKFAKLSSLNTLAFRKGFEYRNSDLHMLNGNIFATFCAILVKIGPLTPEIMPEVSITCRTRRQKLAYLTKYFSKYWTELKQFFRIGSHVYAHYKTEISLAVLGGTLLW